MKAGDIYICTYAATRFYEVGDSVRLSAIGRKTYPNNFHDNPHEEVGVVEGDLLGYSMPYSAGLRGITVTVMLKECLE